MKAKTKLDQQNVALGPMISNRGTNLSLSSSSIRQQRKFCTSSTLGQRSLKLWMTVTTIYSIPNPNIHLNIIFLDTSEIRAVLLIMLFTSPLPNLRTVKQSPQQMSPSTILSMNTNPNQYYGHQYLLCRYTVSMRISIKNQLFS